MERHHRGGYTSPLTIDTSDSEGDSQPLHVASSTSLRIGSPPSSKQRRFAAGTHVYKYFPSKGESLRGRVLDYHPSTEYLVRYDNTEGTLENVPQAEMEYIAAAAAVVVHTSSQRKVTSLQRPKPMLVTRQMTPSKGQEDDDEEVFPQPRKNVEEASLNDTSDEEDCHGTPFCTGNSGNIHRKRASKSNKKNRFTIKRRKQTQEYFENEEEDEDVHVHHAPARRPKKANKALFYARTPKPDDFSESMKQTELAKIPIPADRALQKILFDTGYFRMTLLEHQFMAVRKVAGVPENYPMHENSAIEYADAASISQSLLNWPKVDIRARGVLIADEMGLGKTIEAIAGMVLRNALSLARGHIGRPSIVVGPNDSVLRQWRDAFARNGFPKERLHLFRAGHGNIDLHSSGVVLFADRFALQAELKQIFDEISWIDFDSPNPDPIKALDACVRTRSVLWPSLSQKDLFGLWRQKPRNKETGTESSYRVKNTMRREGEDPSDCVTRLVGKVLNSVEQNQNAVFETAVIDEVRVAAAYSFGFVECPHLHDKAQAHFLKNRCAFWGIATALLAAHSLRSVPVTGTPYCNGPDDLASMISFINPCIRQAMTPWWKDVTSHSRRPEIIAQRCNRITQMYFVRREKQAVLKNMAPKTVNRELVRPYKAEMISYEPYEASLVDLLKEFSRLASYGESGFELQQQFTAMMCMMSCARAANIHAMLPGGREWTIKFSPSRRALVGNESRPSVCVCCNRTMRPSIRLLKIDPSDRTINKHAVSVNPSVEEFESGTLDDDDLDEVEFEKKEKLVPLPFPMCKSISGLRHFVHKRCLENMEEENTSCPRCLHQQNVFNVDYPGCTRYCQNVDGGFPGSSKIDAVVQWQSSVSKDDKVGGSIVVFSAKLFIFITHSHMSHFPQAIIVSFFKGGLDLLEGIFEEKEVSCARFDGDVRTDERDAELARFKEDESCRVLLMTVQTGGVGLNIIEANHVAFLDRWYNPFVHLQAEDRCHRIGQPKTVNIKYFDCNATLDEAMFQLNEGKKNNSAILLADGFKIGQTGQQVTYKDLSGLFSKCLREVRAFRNGCGSTQAPFYRNDAEERNVAPNFFPDIASRRFRNQYFSDEEESSVSSADSEGCNVLFQSGQSL
eukprot:scaffold134_cov94-Amphora_coffeaeformis.AAC.7